LSGNSSEFLAYFDNAVVSFFVFKQFLLLEKDDFTFVLAHFLYDHVSWI